MFPVIMTLRGSVKSLFIFLNSWDGLKSSGHQVIFHLLRARDTTLIVALTHEARQSWWCGSPKSLSKLAQDLPGVPVLFSISQQAWELDGRICPTWRLIRENSPSLRMGIMFRYSIFLSQELFLVFCT